MPASEAIRVRGFRELNLAFKVADKTLQLELRAALREVGEPVRADAEQLARQNVSRIGTDWWQMRTGVTTKVVYVAPKQRSRSGNPALKRPKFAALLLGRSMEPALERNESLVEQRMGRMLDTVGAAWEAV